VLAPPDRINYTARHNSMLRFPTVDFQSQRSHRAVTARFHGTTSPGRSSDPTDASGHVLERRPLLLLSGAQRKIQSARSGHQDAPRQDPPSSSSVKAAEMSRTALLLIGRGGTPRSDAMSDFAPDTTPSATIESILAACPRRRRFGDRSCGPSASDHDRGRARMSRPNGAFALGVAAPERHLFASATIASATGGRSSDIGRRRPDDAWGSILKSPHRRRSQAWPRLRSGGE
jgi:hypothetical protein